MLLRTKSRGTGFSRKEFLIGPPQDSDDLLQLFSLVLERADVEVRAGKRFGVPFASFLKLAHHNPPSSDGLAEFCLCTTSGGFSSGSYEDWPTALRSFRAQTSRTITESGGLENATAANVSTLPMFPDLLQFALDSAPIFGLEGKQICRLLAAVGQTLEAANHKFRQHNRSLADRHRSNARKRTAPPISEPPPSKKSTPVRATEEPIQIAVTKQLPWQMDFRRPEEEAGCLNLAGAVLWHASYIGPSSGEKTENQDATFAVTTTKMSSPPYLVFALADGVTTSLGSRLAATSIVRRFCELLLQQINNGEKLTGSDLIQAAQKTQIGLEELTRNLLQDSNSPSFETMLGSELTRKVATRVLQNTLEPRVAAMPAALNATLIGGVVQPSGSPGSFQVELLRIGDGTVEHIGTQGELTSILDTDPEVMRISEAMGPGPQSRALFEDPSDPHRVSTVTLGPGESLLISSDGLTRGHTQPISRKLEELLGEPFWKKAQPEEADAALRILHRACSSADDLFLQDAKQSLFADNVSLILIRAEG